MTEEKSDEWKIALAVIIIILAPWFALFFSYCKMDDVMEAINESNTYQQQLVEYIENREVEWKMKALKDEAREIISAKALLMGECTAELRWNDEERVWIETSRYCK